MRMSGHGSAARSPLDPHRTRRRVSLGLPDRQRVPRPQGSTGRIGVITQSATALAAIGALVFTGVSLIVTQDQNLAQNDLTAQAQYTDRYTKAIEQLGQLGVDRFVRQVDPNPPPAEDPGQQALPAGAQPLAGADLNRYRAHWPGRQAVSRYPTRGDGAASSIPPGAGVAPTRTSAWTKHVSSGTAPVLCPTTTTTLTSTRGGAGGRQ